jgi:hypothetical protein
VSGGKEFGENARKKFNFARRTNKFVVNKSRRVDFLFNFLK